MPPIKLVNFKVMMMVMDKVIKSTLICVLMITELDLLRRNHELVELFLNVSREIKFCTDNVNEFEHSKLLNPSHFVVLVNSLRPILNR